MDNKTVIYLVRHGSIPLKDGEAREKNPSLDVKGKSQAKYLANEFYNSNEKIDIIFTSTMNRAIETAEIISSKIKIKVNRLDSLSEFSKSVFSDSVFSFNFWKHYIKYKNSLRTFNRIDKKHKGKTILFAVHGQVIKGIVGNKLKIPFRDRIKLSYNHCHITRLTFKNDKLMTLSYFNSKNIL